jgi:hypothetical protein
LARKPIDVVQMELEPSFPGSGWRLDQYVQDVRTENHLDIRKEDGRLVCHGRLP